VQLKLDGDGLKKCLKPADGGCEWLLHQRLREAAARKRRQKSESSNARCKFSSAVSRGAVLALTREGRRRWRWFNGKGSGRCGFLNARISAKYQIGSDLATQIHRLIMLTY
jgi:hypothetical protein